MDMIQGEKRWEHRGEVLEVDRPRRLVFTWNAEWLPGGSTVTVVFHPVDGGTEIVLRHDGLPDQDSADNHEDGWGDILEALEAELAREGDA